MKCFSSSCIPLTFPSSCKLFSFLLLLVFHSVATANASTKIPPHESVPAVILFGDSIVDAGNNNDLKTLVKSNFPPYGIDFYGGVPTGRFCDGKVPSDLLAEELGVKPVVPAYLDPNLKPQDLLTGVTFASGASGYDPLTSKLASVISLSDQLKYFEEYIEKLKGIVGEERTSFIIAKSIVFVVSGSNDIANTYFLLRGRQLQYDVPAYTDLMVSYATDFVNKLYGHGARRIGVISAPPIGCVPSQRTLAGGLLRDCAADHNEAATLFNSKLSRKLGSMSRALPGSKVVYLDVYSTLLDLIQNPNKYGFEVADKGCCGTGDIEVSVLCNRYTSSTCSNVSAYVFWDSYHPTERAYRVLTTQLIDKYLHLFF